VRNCQRSTIRRAFSDLIIDERPAVQLLTAGNYIGGAEGSGITYPDATR
jgi:hypothetical protein